MHAGVVQLADLGIAQIEHFGEGSLVRADEARKQLIDDVMANLEGQLPLQQALEEQGIGVIEASLARQPMIDPAMDILVGPQAMTLATLVQCPGQGRQQLCGGSDAGQHELDLVDVEDQAVAQGTGAGKEATLKAASLELRQHMFEVITIAVVEAQQHRLLGQCLLAAPGGDHLFHGHRPIVPLEMVELSAKGSKLQRLEARIARPGQRSDIVVHHDGQHRAKLLPCRSTGAVDRMPCIGCRASASVHRRRATRRSSHHPREASAPSRSRRHPRPERSERRPDRSAFPCAPAAPWPNSARRRQRSGHSRCRPVPGY